MASTPRTILIWDLGNTLLTAHKLRYAYEIGLTDLMLYALLDWKNPTKIYGIIFDFLEQVEIVNHSAYRITTDRGKFLPAIMCHWLGGNLNRQEAINATERLLHTWSDEGRFINERQERLVRNAIQVIFTPDKLVRCIRPIDAGVSILKECAERKNEMGMQRNELYILSNWDPLSFKPLTNSSSLTSLFRYFKEHNIVISGHIGALKPQPAIYEHFLAKYNHDPQACILIDDQAENLAAAERYGMAGLLIENGNYRKLRTQLKEFKSI